MTQIDPQSSMANLIYTGYRGNPASALHLTRSRKVDRKQQKPFSETDTTTTGERWAVNVVDEVVGSKKTLILREIPEDETKFFLSRNNSLAACDRCDVAVFVYDSSDEHSWKSAKELLAELANKGDESENYLVPCLLIAAKDDLNPHPMAVQDSLEVSQELCIEAPIRVSTKQSNLNNVFRRIVCAAEHPHMSIPESEKRKYRRHLLDQSLNFVFVGTAAAVIGFALYRYCAAK